MNTPADIGIRKIEMAVIHDEAEKMGVPGKHWLRIVTQTLKSGGGKVKVIDVKGDYADIVANHPLGHVMGPVRVPARALVAVYRPIQMVKPWTDASGTPVDPDKMQMQPLRRRPDYGEIEMEIEKRMKEQNMNKIAVANELVKIAKSLTARKSLLDSVLIAGDVAKLRDVVDEQSYELAVDVYQKLFKDLEISENQNEAILRLKQCVQRGSSMDPDAHRNNIFKAAHALGIHLPSSMF